MATQIGPKIGIDGEKEYRQQLRQIIDETKNLGAALEKTASEWGVNTSQMTKNKAIAQNLVKQIDLQKEKLSVMNEMLEKSTEKFGENSQATQNWKRAVDQATASLNRMESELKELHGAQNFSTFSTKIADAGTAMQNVGQKMVGIGQRMTTAITLPITAAATASVKLASDLEESSSKVDVIFGSMSESVKSFTETSLESFGLSNVKAMEMLGSFGALATQMGISDRAAAEMATTLTGLSGDLASFHNTQADVAASALEGIFTGQTKALTRFAGAIREVDLEAFAQKQGKVYSSMTEAEKVMTRYQLVLERTRDAQGDYARTSDGTANSIHTFQGSLEQLGAILGEQILPIITPIIQELTEMVKAFADLPEPVQKAIVYTLLLAAALGPLILAIGALVSACGAIAAALPEIGMAIAAIAAGIAAGVLIGEALASIEPTINNLVIIVRGAWDILLKLNDKLKNSVNSTVSDIVSAFASMPEKIVTAIKNAAQKVKDTFDQMIQNAKQSGAHFVQGFVDGIKEKISKVVEVVKKVANTIKDFLGFTRPDKGPLHEYEEWMPHFMQGLAKGIRGNVGLVRNAVNDVAKTMSLPLDANASMNMALSGADGSSYIGGTTMNVYVDHVSELNDLLRIQNQAQQRYRMGAK